MRVLDIRGRRAAFAAASLVAVLTLGACGGGNDEEPASGNADSAALGAENAATGEPIVIGYATTGQTQTLDFSDEIRGGQAAADYANEHLGGIGGRPIELLVCEERGTPAGAQECGNKFVSEKVAAVVGSSPGQIDPWLQQVVPAGIPVALNFASLRSVLTTPGVFVFNNPLAAFGSAAAYARENDLKKAVIVVLDLPASAGPAAQLGPIFFGNVGGEVNVVPIAPGTPDMTPQIQAAENDGPQMYHIVGDPAFCTAAIKAIKTLGIDSPITAIDRCIGDDRGASIPGGFEGVTITSQANIDPADEEFQLFSAVLDTYGPEIKDTLRAAGGYQAVLSFARALNASKATDLSPAGIRTALETMPATPYPLGGGATFQCNGEAIPAISKNICSAMGIVADASKTGELSGFRTLDTEGIYEMG
jgi:branched-chain amino acid transport system substrate-binding protein